MPENTPLKYVRFWQEVYIAAVRSGKQSTEAAQIANSALTDLLKLSTEKM
jgi:hypothetical protein